MDEYVKHFELALMSILNLGQKDMYLLRMGGGGGSSPSFKRNQGLIVGYAAGG